MTKDEKRLQDHLDDKPDDARTRLILADLFEEQGREAEARCQRWMAEERKWPDSDLKDYEESGWRWWPTPDWPRCVLAHAAIPVEVHAGMPKGAWLFAKRTEAEKALADAMAVAPPPPAKAKAAPAASSSPASAGSPGERRRFEFVEGTSSKFWEVWVEGTKLYTHYGRIGGKGQTTVKDFPDEAKTKKEYDKLVKEKTGKGYIEQT